VKRILLLALVLAACGSDKPVLTASPQAIVQDKVNEGFLAQVTLNFWLRADDGRHRALCVLAQAEHYLNQPYTVDIIAGQTFDTETLVALCKRVPAETTTTEPRTTAS